MLGQKALKILISDLVLLNMLLLSFGIFLFYLNLSQRSLCNEIKSLALFDFNFLTFIYTFTSLPQTFILFYLKNVKVFTLL